MFRLWGKEWKDNRMVRDTVICDETDDARIKFSTHWMPSAMNLT